MFTGIREPVGSTISVPTVGVVVTPEVKAKPPMFSHVLRVCLVTGLVAGIGGCAASGDQAGAAVADQATVTPAIIHDEGVLMTCGGDLPSFPTSALDSGLEGLPQEAEIKAALDDVGVNAGLGGARLVPGQAPPDRELRVLASQVTETSERLLVAVGRWDLALGPVEGNQFYVVLDRQDATLRATGWGNCALAPAA